MLGLDNKVSLPSLTLGSQSLVGSGSSLTLGSGSAPLVPETALVPAPLVSETTLESAPSLPTAFQIAQDIEKQQLAIVGARTSRNKKKKVANSSGGDRCDFEFET